MSKREKIKFGATSIFVVLIATLIMWWDSNSFDIQEQNRELFSQESVEEGVIKDIKLTRDDKGETFTVKIDNGETINLLGYKGGVYWIDEHKHGDVGIHYAKLRQNTLELNEGDKVEYKTANVYGYNENERNELTVLTKHETNKIKYKKQ